MTIDKGNSDEAGAYPGSGGSESGTRLSWAMRVRRGRRSGRLAWLRPRVTGRGRAATWGIAGISAIAILAGVTPAAAGHAAADADLAAATQTSGGAYQATIVRTAYGVPHITAGNFGSLGFGYGYALASDDLCTMAQIYVTVEGDRSRYFGANAQASAPAGGHYSNVDSDIFWQSVIGRQVIPRLLAVRTGAGAIGPQVRQLMAGYVAGYNHYLASVGGARGVPDPTCRGQAWVQPITALDGYLAVYQIADIEGVSSSPDVLAGTQPPAAATTLSASAVRAAPGVHGQPTASELRKLASQGPSALSGFGSNAIAIGSAGASDHQHGILLGNPHIPWQGALRLYQVQLTIPGTMNVEGASLMGIPVVVIGFTSSVAWSETTSRSWTVTPYQLILVPGHPTEYVYNGRPVDMTAQTVTVPTLGAHGTVGEVRHTLWFTRYGPVINGFQGVPLNWTGTTAYTLDDANAGNLRILSEFLSMDEAGSAAQVLSALKKYEGVPWNNTRRWQRAVRRHLAGTGRDRCRGGPL
jgi:acyl-homoserine-lactone acylase